MQNKRGESLVEVVVALGIFAFVFMGVINIVAGSVTLNVSARQRMESVAMVQKNLNQYLAAHTNVGLCSITNRGSGDPDICKDTPLAESTQTCYWIEIHDLNDDAAKGPIEEDEGRGLVSPNFVKITAYGRWYTRILGQQEFSISRVVWNN